MIWSFHCSVCWTDCRFIRWHRSFWWSFVWVEAWKGFGAELQEPPEHACPNSTCTLSPGERRRCAVFKDEAEFLFQPLHLRHTSHVSFCSEWRIVLCKRKSSFVFSFVFLWLFWHVHSLNKDAPYSKPSHVVFKSFFFPKNALKFSTFFPFSFFLFKARHLRTFCFCEVDKHTLLLSLLCNEREMFINHTVPPLQHPAVIQFVFLKTFWINKKEDDPESFKVKHVFVCLMFLFLEIKFLIPNFKNWLFRDEH